MPVVRPYSLPDYYLTSISTGLRSLTGAFPREAAARLVNPLSYPRFREYDLTVNRLEVTAGCRILDIGSPKLPILVLARHAGCEVYATDIREYFIGPTAEFLRRNGLGHRLGRDIHLQAQDARHLGYRDASFDRVFSISVLEHIPDEGDAQAMREVARVLRPGGLVALTVPYSGRGYEEEFVQGDVFERRGTGTPTFYQRHYDDAALQTRLISPSGLLVVEQVLFGEPGLRFEPYWNKIPMRWKVPLLWAQPFIAELLLKPVDPGRKDAAVGVALKLAKPAA